MIWLYGVLLVAVIVGELGLVIALGVHGYFMLHNSVPYVGLPKAAMKQVMTAMAVRNDDVVYDLGCGDGRVLRALLEHNPQARYVGVENDFAVWLGAWWRLRGRAQVVRREMAGVPLGDATRVFVYLGPSLMAELEPRFEAELPAGTRVVSVQFALPHRQADEVVTLVGSPRHAACMYLYNY